MATKRRAYIIKLFILIIFCMLISFFIGMYIKPTETIVKHEIETITVEKPVYIVTNPDFTKDFFIYDIPLSSNLQTYIYELCEEEKISISLILAMIEQESGFNADIISKSNDYGLMQINKINHQWLFDEYQCNDMLNPYQNVFCGIKIISKYIKKYEDYSKALMAYNMGEYGAKKSWDDGIFETKYSKNIINKMNKYERLTNEQ